SANTLRCGEVVQIGLGHSSGAGPDLSKCSSRRIIRGHALTNTIGGECLINLVDDIGDFDGLCISTNGAVCPANISIGTIILVEPSHALSHARSAPSWNTPARHATAADGSAKSIPISHGRDCTPAPVAQ